MARKSKRTLDVQPSDEGAQIKPGELIDVHLPTTLTLNDQRRWNLLLWNAWDRADQPETEHTIHLDELRFGHDSTDRLHESIERLMAAVVSVRATGAKGQPVTRRAQLLGGNDMDDPERPDGVLTYTFDRRLVSIIKNSTLWGQLRKEIMASFSSKYALKVYELAEKRVNLKYKNHEEWSIKEFRGLLGVPEGKLMRWADLNRRAVAPAVSEVNQLCDFEVEITPLKRGRMVTGVRFSWAKKDAQTAESAARERRSARVGRKARRDGTAEQIADTPPPPPDAQAKAWAWWETLPSSRKGALTRKHERPDDGSRNDKVMRAWQAEGQPDPERSTMHG